MLEDAEHPRQRLADKEIYKQDIHTQGMTLREYYAGQAINGLIAKWGCNNNEKAYADVAVRVSDALIAALQRRA